MHGADLVARRIAQIGQDHGAEGALAFAGRILDGATAGGDAGVVEGLDHLGRIGVKADGSAIGVAGGVAVDGLADGEGAYASAPPVAALGVRPLPRLDAQGAERGVIESARRLYVVGADGDVSEYGEPS